MPFRRSCGGRYGEPSLASSLYIFSCIPFAHFGPFLLRTLGCVTLPSLSSVKRREHDEQGGNRASLRQRRLVARREFLGTPGDRRGRLPIDPSPSAVDVGDSRSHVRDVGHRQGSHLLGSGNTGAPSGRRATRRIRRTLQGGVIHLPRTRPVVPYL